MLGVKSHARGAFDSGVLHGSRTAYATLTQVREGWVVYPKLMAWEGALAQVPAELDGRWVTPEFVTYEIGSKELSGDYLGNLMAWSGFVEWVRAGSSGTNVRRRRLQPDNFEAITIPLPPRHVQDSIAEHLKHLAALARPRSRDPLASLGWQPVLGQTVRVGELVEPVVRRVQPVADALYQMQGVRWYGEGLFTREARLGADLPSSVYRIEPGDLVYNRLFAWKQSFALAESVGWASNEFPAFRVNTQRVRPRVLLAALLGPSFTAAVNEASTGSTPTSRNRLKERDFLSLPIVLPLPENQTAMEAALLIADSIKPLLDKADAVSAAVLPAARNEIFDSMR